MEINTILQGDVLEVTRTLPDNSVNCIVTSPPYWGLRDYQTGEWFGGDDNCDHRENDNRNNRDKGLLKSGIDGNNHIYHPYKTVCAKCGAIRKDKQLGLEATPEEYIAKMVEIFRELRRVLREDGTCWLNLGDSYAANRSYQVTDNKHRDVGNNHGMNVPANLKTKDLVGIPWRVALALQADGWWLRSDIIWAKVNPMPESVTDRPTKAHEYIFLLTKRATYWYDQDAIREPHTQPWDETNSNRGNYTGPSSGYSIKTRSRQKFSHAGLTQQVSGRNKRTVWEVATKPFSGSKLLTDYVGRDGKPYRLSPDCPIHSQRARNQRIYKALCDELPNQSETHNPDTDNHPVQEPVFLQSPNLTPDNSDVPPSNQGYSYQSNSEKQIDESNFDNKMTSQMTNEHEQILIGEMEYYTSRKLDQSKDYHHDLDCSCPSCSRIAIDHNNQTHKTDHDLLTNQPYKPYAQISDDTEYTLEQPDFDGTPQNSLENKTAEGELGDNQDIQNHDDTAHNLQQQGSYAAKDTSDKDINTLYCTCTIVSIDHFAVFPPKLIEPCVLAGCPAQVCAECGEPWVRVVERKPVPRDITSHRNKSNWAVGARKRNDTDLTRSGQEAAKWKFDNPDKFYGFTPTCFCSAPTRPGVVLDPFIGSGTTAIVAIQKGRDWLGIELNSEYIEMAEERIAQTQPVLPGIFNGH